MTLLRRLSGWADVNISALWHEHLESQHDPPSYRTLRSWYSKGTTLTRLAEGGEYLTHRTRRCSELPTSQRIHLHAPLASVVRSECVLLWFAGYELYQVITVVRREGEILDMEGL